MAGGIFVTGASGMVGANLVRRLVGEGKEVTVLLRKNSTHSFLSGLRVNKVYGDITDRQSIEKGMINCDYVYHIAGHISYNKHHHATMHNVNVVGTRNVMGAALDLGISRVVHTSSTAAIGIAEDKKSPLDESHDFKETYKSIGYMATKNLAEKEASKAYKKGLDVVIVNPSTIIGKGDEKMNSGIIFKNISLNKIRIAPPGGNSVVSVHDVIEGHLLAMQRGKGGERYILNAENLDYLKMFNIISEELGVRKIKRILPKGLYLPLNLFSRILEGANKNAKLNPQLLFFTFKFRYFDSSKARKELGWKPKQSVRAAVREAIISYRENNLIS